MPTARYKTKVVCYFVTKRSSKMHPIIDSLKGVMQDVQGKLIISKNKKNFLTYSIDERELNEISNSDIILLDSGFLESEIYYGVGLAHALGKPIISIFLDEDYNVANKLLPPTLNFNVTSTKDGIEHFKVDFKNFLKEYIQDPLKYRLYFPYLKREINSSYLIDLEKLGSREYENLCFELISQMGFKKVSWGTEMKDFDLVATLPKKDPDGFEYQEIWLVVTGNNAPVEKILEMVSFEPEYIYRRLQRIFDEPSLFSRIKHSMRPDTPVTVLFILRGLEYQDSFERRIDKVEYNLIRNKRSQNLRIRSWDHNYLIRLIQSYPQISYKYFSEKSRAESLYRKSPEELYNENILLTEEVLSAKATIEEEKRKRFIAERETAWRDVAFKAAHKLGNPVDATDTFLQSLKRKLSSNDIIDAMKVADMMDESIEEAKSVIGQFKSLTKIEEINAASIDIVKLVKSSCKIAEESGVKVSISATPSVIKAFVDPKQTIECFHELIANSLHWFKKDERIINISITKSVQKELPEPLDQQRKYVIIIYNDNGSGIIDENKEKIFSPFFSTYQHGTGLGLSIVKRVIELQDGWIMENGNPLEGASFIIYLPLEKINVGANK